MFRNNFSAKDVFILSKKYSKVSSNTHTKSQLDNYANQNNPNSYEYKANKDNRSNQLNPNNVLYKK